MVTHRWWPSEDRARTQRTQQPLPTFRPVSIVAKRSPISATAGLLLTKFQTKTSWFLFSASRCIKKSSSVAGLGDPLNWPNKLEGAAVPLSVLELGPHLKNVAWAEAYLRTKWHPDPSNRLVTIHQRYRQDRHENGPKRFRIIRRR